MQETLIKTLCLQNGMAVPAGQIKHRVSIRRNRRNRPAQGNYQLLDSYFIEAGMPRDTRVFPATAVNTAAVCPEGRSGCTTEEMM